jgi:FHS family L-fucose permease-like MFS transporter
MGGDRVGPALGDLSETGQVHVNDKHKHLATLAVLTSLFFMWGLITSLNDILIPHLKGAFSLTYLEVMLIQFCFFGAYFVSSLPSGQVVRQIGYKRGIIAGLTTAGVGCLLIYAAASAHSYSFFLGALFILASGITLLQVAANPYVAILGTPRTASSRLVLTQAFNSLGTTIGPFVGAILILSSSPLTTATSRQTAEAATVQGPYLGLAATLIALAALIAFVHLPQIQDSNPRPVDTAPGHKTVWQYAHLVLGAVAIFVYVGAEVSIGSFLVNFISQPQVANLSEAEAGKYLSLYWGGAMVGRFIGAVVLTRVPAGRVLAFSSLVAVLLLATAMTFSGRIAMWTLLATGLFNSIMFPTIFTLAIAGLGRHTSSGSGVLCMAIVGGAIVPLVQGAFADQISLLHSFLIPLVCYVYIVHYGFKGHRIADLRSQTELIESTQKYEC